MDTSEETAALRIAAEVARQWAAGNVEAIVARMDAAMAEQLPGSKLAEIWASLVAQLGPFGEVGEAWTESRGPMVIVRTPLEFRARGVDLKLAISGPNLFGLFIAPRVEPFSPWRLPDYADAARFREVEVVFGPRATALPGTLSLPQGASTTPAVVLVHGSGPQDRDESLGPNRPFRDLAAGLATRGVAVLRYDKRTKVHPSSFTSPTAPTVREEVVDDARFAVEFLRARPEIDARRIALLGHSLGGTLGPRIASGCPAIAKLVLLAAAARSLPDIAVEQIEYLSSLRGAPSAEERAKCEAMRAEAARVRAARPGDDGPGFLGAPLSYWADLNVHDPVAVAADLAIPMLILQGERDYQVTMADFSRFVGALEGRRDVECVSLPRLNHLFMSGEGKSTPAEYDRAGHVDPEVIDRIARFLLGEASDTIKGA